MSPRPRGFDPDQVLEAAMVTFWKKGYEATSAQDLVDGTGLGRGSLYHAFDSKYGLFQAALKRYDAERTSRLVEVLERGEGPARDRIRAVLLDVVAQESTEPPAHRGCLAVNSAMELAGRDARVTQYVRDTFARVTDALTVCVEQGIADGSLDHEGPQPGLRALHLLNSMYGLRVLGKVTDRARLTALVDQILPPAP
ncbi:TetR/AcrR family transcriptional regulator [Streptomyces sp. NPDC004111]|uniref:TetR/AcrR family transcriptional regulator n=1 Tax=Streptomyces sp. NPDC004111 TaxID=3364690 RepID=UPI003679FE1B